jgi:hypothetical protein
MLLSEPVLTVIRRELRRLSPDVKIEIDEIQAVLTNEVIKREVLEDEKAESAKRKIARSASKSLRNTSDSVVENKPSEAVSTDGQS